MYNNSWYDISKIINGWGHRGVIMAKAKKKTTKSASAETRTRRVEVEPSNNDSLIRKIIIIVLVLIGLYLLLNFVSGWQDDKGEKAADDKGSSEVEKSDEADKKDNTDTKTEAEPNGTSSSETDTEFSYVVGEGESYTTMARRAVASIDGTLSTAERVAAETRLTTDANAQWLNRGQDLTLSKDTVRAAVDWAKSLSAEQKAAWQPYADLIAW